VSSTWKVYSARGFAPLYQGPSAGFVYVWSTTQVHFKWRAYTVAPFWYSDGDTTISAKTAVWFGIPTPYVQFEVQPDFDIALLGT
jgi:hypothetical protein